jgi:hypothetical protein
VKHNDDHYTLLDLPFPKAEKFVSGPENREILQLLMKYLTKSSAYALGLFHFLEKEKTLLPPTVGSDISFTDT